MSRGVTQRPWADVQGQAVQGPPLLIIVERHGGHVDQRHFRVPQLVTTTDPVATQVPAVAIPQIAIFPRFPTHCH